MIQEKIEFYRKKAIELREIAGASQTSEAREVLHHIAEVYERLANELVQRFLKE